MSPSTNTCSVTTTSAETTTLALANYNSSYVTQTDLANTIKVLLANFDDKHAKQDFFKVICKDNHCKQRCKS